MMVALDEKGGVYIFYSLSPIYEPIPGLQDNFIAVGKEKVWIAPIYPACR